MQQPFYAVRVTLTHDDGSTTTRDYVRGQTPMARDTFGQFALGNLLSLATAGEPVSWQVVSLDPSDVR